MSLNLNNHNKPDEEVSTDVLSFDSSDFDFADDILETDKDTLNAPVQNLSPKETLINFLRDSVLDEDYIFDFAGSYVQAEAFIQRMRVALSRFRAEIIKLNKPLNHFYVLTKSIEVKSDTYCTVTLIKSKQRKKKIESKVNDVLDFLTL